MGYVPQFQNDIFISYRRVLNEDKWVDAFLDDLRKYLRSYIDNVTIWRDTSELRAGDQWRAEISDALDSTAIFLAIVSRTYLDSDVCRKELNRFLGKVKDPKEGVRRKIIPVLRDPVRNTKEIPREIGDAPNRHQFFKEDPPNWRTFGQIKDEEDRRDFAVALYRLAQDLMWQLEKLNDAVRDNMKGKIFLAQVGPESHLDREELRSDLLQRGYWVVPENAYISNTGNFEEELAADLSTAEMCIHIVGGSAASGDDDLETYELTRIQLERAVQTMKAKNKPILVWIKPGDADPETRSLVAYVERDLANEGVEYFRGSLEDFKTDVIAKLGALPSPTSVQDLSDIALLVEETDLAATEQVSALVVDQLGRELPKIVFREARPREPESFKSILDRCGQCIIFWGSQKEAWLWDILALHELKERLGDTKLCVYVPGPETSEQRVFRTKKARKIPTNSENKEKELTEWVKNGEKC